MIGCNPHIGQGLLGLIALIELAAVRGQSEQLTDVQPAQMPPVGAYQLRVLSPTVLEITRINTKPPDPARVDSWDFVGGDFQLHVPDASEFSVTVNGQQVAVTDVGFKRLAPYSLVERVGFWDAQ